MNSNPPVRNYFPLLSTLRAGGKGARSHIAPTKASFAFFLASKRVKATFWLVLGLCRGPKSLIALSPWPGILRYEVWGAHGYLHDILSI
jgi:hypothetical protein